MINNHHHNSTFVKKNTKHKNHQEYHHCHYIHHPQHDIMCMHLRQKDHNDQHHDNHHDNHVDDSHDAKETWYGGENKDCGGDEDKEKGGERIDLVD